jgi:hypothetical protein
MAKVVLPNPGGPWKSVWSKSFVPLICSKRIFNFLIPDLAQQNHQKTKALNNFQDQASSGL